MDTPSGVRPSPGAARLKEGMTQVKSGAAGRTNIAAVGTTALRDQRAPELATGSICAGRGWLALSILAFALALLAKSSVVVLPFVLLLLDWWRRGRITRADVLRSIPYFALSFASGLISLWIQHRAIGANFSTDSPLVRMIGGSWAFWFYLAKIVLPLNLTLLYPRWEIDPKSILSYLPALTTLAMFTVFWRHRKGWGRPWLFASGYFLLALGPVLGVFNMSFFGFSRAADHLQYLA